MRRRESALPIEPASPALFLSAEAPYPLAGGGALRSASLLHYLARTRDVDVIVFRQPGDPDPAVQLPGVAPSILPAIRLADLARRVTVIDLPPHSRRPSARAWRTASRLARRALPLVDRFAGFGRQIDQATAGRRYGIGIVEHSWCAPYWENISKICEGTALDLHNIESVLHARCADLGRGPAALAHRAFRKMSLDLEREWLPRYTWVLAVSESDADEARRIAPSARALVYPNAIPAVPPPPRAEEDVILFTGNMEYHPNVSAVRFFRREIWPLLRERWPALVWRLAGKNPGAVARYTAGDARIEVLGPVDNAVRELARAKIAVVPLLAASGARFKILEAWAAATAVVSTTLGAEGLAARDGEHLLLADSAPAFAEAVSHLLANSEDRQRLGMAGRRLLEKQYTWDAAWRMIEF
jgi:glycosyltransferase involved in cell wall biosynthesis